MKTIKQIAVENKITNIQLGIKSNDKFPSNKYNNVIRLCNSEHTILIHTNKNVKAINILNVMHEHKVFVDSNGLLVLEGD